MIQEWALFERCEKTYKILSVVQQEGRVEGLVVPKRYAVAVSYPRVVELEFVAPVREA